MTQRNTQILPLIKLSHQLAVMTLLSQSAMEHFGLLSPRLHTPLFLYVRNAVHGLLLYITTNNLLVPKPAKNVQFFKVPFLSILHLLGKLSVHYSFQFIKTYCNLFCFTAHVAANANQKEQQQPRSQRIIQINPFVHERTSRTNEQEQNIEKL